MFPSVTSQFRRSTATNPSRNTIVNDPTNSYNPTQNTLQQSPLEDENVRLERQVEQATRGYQKLKEEVEKSDKNLERLRTENQELRKMLVTSRSSGEINAVGLQDTHGHHEEFHISTSSYQARPEVRITQLQSRLDLVEWQIGQLITLADLHEMAMDDLEARIESRDNSQKSHYDDFSAQFAEPEVSLRGGMGGQIEDEEHVYGDGEYVNWDQVDEEREERFGHEGKFLLDEGEDNENEEIRELRRHIERLEVQVKKLSEQTEVETDSVRRQKHSTSFSLETSSSPNLSKTQPRLLVERSVVELDQETIVGAGKASARISQPQPHIRGSHGSRPSRSVFERVQRTASDHHGFGEEFDRIYDRLLQDSADASCHPPSNECINAWIKLATVLQTRNRQIERELEEFKEIHHSLVQDVCWLMETQVELEEQIQTAEEEKAELTAELEALRTRWETVERFLASPLRSPVESAPSKELEGQNAEPVSWEMLPNTNDSLLDLIDPPDHDLTPSTSEPSASHIAATCFTFFPSRSTILIPTSTSSSPPQIFQFPSSTNLLQIQSILSCRHTHGLEDNPYAVRIREILEIREEMGITLPNEFKKESVVIGIPDLSAQIKIDDLFKVDAWESVSQEGDEGAVTQLRCLKMDADHQCFRNEGTAVRPRGNEEWYCDVGDLVNELNRMADELSDIASTSSRACRLCRDGQIERSDGFETDACPCWVCEDGEAEGYVTIWAPDSPPSPIVSVRGGGDEECSRTPGVEIGKDDSRSPGLIPVAQVLPIQCLGLTKVQKKEEINEELTFVIKRPGDMVIRRGRMFEVHDLRDITNSALTSPRFTSLPPNSTERLGSPAPRGIGLLISFSPDQPEHLSLASHNNRPHSNEKSNLQIEEDISMWCHPRGEGCETWFSCLDPERDTCEFCHMPFGDERGFEREHSGNSTEHEDDAPIPTAPTRILPQKLSNKGKQAIVGDAGDVEDVLVRGDIARLRGGAASEHDLYDREEEDWHSEWNRVAAQTYCSGCQCQIFRNSSTLSVKTVVKIPSPVDRGYNARRHRDQPPYFHSGYEAALDNIQSALSEVNNIEPRSMTEISQKPSGKSNRLLSPVVPAIPTDLTRTKTYPLSKRERCNVEFDHVFRTSEPIFLFHQRSKPAVRKIFALENEKPDEKLERWLENPRPAPPGYAPPRGLSLWRKEERSNRAEEKTNQSGSVGVNATVKSVRMTGPKFERRRTIDHSATKKAFLHSETSPQVPNRLETCPPNDYGTFSGTHPSSSSLTRISLRKRITNILRLLRQYIKRLVSLPSLGARHRSARERQSPHSKPKNTPLPSPLENLLRIWNVSNPFLQQSPHSRPSLPPTLPPTPPPKDSSPLLPAPSLPSSVTQVIRPCYAYAEEPCIAGPSNPKRTSNLSAAKENTDRKRDGEEYDGMMGLETRIGVRGRNWVKVEGR